MATSLRRVPRGFYNIRRSNHERWVRAMTLNAVIYRDESGVYCAEIPSLPGCCSDGDTFEQATANIREAAEGWLAAQDEANMVEHADAVRVAL